MFKIVKEFQVSKLTKIQQVREDPKTFKPSEACNIWVIRSPLAVVVIDAGTGKYNLYEYLDRKVDYLLLTHAHFDHFGGAIDFPDEIVYGSAFEDLDDASKIFTGVFKGQKRFEFRYKQNTLPIPERIELEPNVFLESILTRGHSVDSYCFYVKEWGAMFTGDVFLGSWKKEPMIWSEYQQEHQEEFFAIRQNILETYELKIGFPGHGEAFSAYICKECKIARTELMCGWCSTIICVPCHFIHATNCKAQKSLDF